MPEQLRAVDHGYIRYANCWEDADVLLEGLQVRPGDRVLSIGSAGDNSFSLLTCDPALVVAVDINLPQLQLIELKIAAIRALDRESYLRFAGFREADDRHALFDRVRGQLDPGTAAFWEAHLSAIQAGIITQGKFENYFRLFRRRVLPLIHGRRTIGILFDVKSDGEQGTFYRKRWNSWRWRMLFKLFFSRGVMGRFGRDPAFLKEVDVNVGEFIHDRAARHLSKALCQRNEFLEFIMTGTFQRALPHYVREENYERIRANLDRLLVFQGFAEEAGSAHGPFDRFNLSNIFEYMDGEVFQHVANGLLEHATPQARLAYWNLMVPRRISAILPDRARYDEALSTVLTSRDKGFFYRAVHVDEVK